MESYGSDELLKQFQKLTVTTRSKKGKNKKYDQDYFPAAGKVRAYVNRSPERYYWLRHPNEIQLNWTIDLTPGTKQFNAVVEPIKEYVGSSIQVYNVYKITNKFLERQYELKKEHKELKASCNEYRMYHFTVKKNLDDIITNNFNWRLSGSSKSHKYGYGICFSPDPEFAEQFCKSNDIKVLLVVKVLVSATHVGKPNVALPNSGFDTTVSPKKTVYVKFEDSEFYPEYLVYYRRNG